MKCFRELFVCTSLVIVKHSFNFTSSAIAGRLEKSIQGLPPPYRLNIPKLALVTSSEARCQLKPPNYSVNWVVSKQHGECWMSVSLNDLIEFYWLFDLETDKVEIINSFTGKTVCNKYSRLTKQNMFRRFARILSQLPSIQNRSIDKDYSEEKAAAVEYQVWNASRVHRNYSNRFRIHFQNAKQELICAFQREELGNWLKKPIEQDQFPLLSNEKWLVSADDNLRTLFTFFLFLFLSISNDKCNGTKRRQVSDSIKLLNKISTKSGNNNNNNYRSSSRIRIPMILALECYLLE